MTIAALVNQFILRPCLIGTTMINNVTTNFQDAPVRIDTTRYPSSLASVPVVWGYSSDIIPLDVSADLMGVCYYENGGFRPVSGSAIADKEEPPASLLFTSKNRRGQPE